jgi:hypothetical protein
LQDAAGRVGQDEISPSRLGTGGGGKTGTAAAFSDELGAPVADGGFEDFLKHEGK